MSLQNRVNKFFVDLGETGGIPTVPTFLKVRDKVCPEIFKHLTIKVVSFFYEHFGDYGLLQRYKGRQLVTVDVSLLNMPDSPETRKVFTLIDNKSGHPNVQAMTSFLYDVLQDIPLNAEIGQIQALILINRWLIFYEAS